MFNFNSPAISHDELTHAAGQAFNGYDGNFGPAADVFQKKNEQSGLQGLAPQAPIAFPQGGEQTATPGPTPTGETAAAFDPAIQQQWLQQQTRQPAQPTFGEAMPSAPSSQPAFRAPLPPFAPPGFSMPGAAPFPMSTPLPAPFPQVAKAPQAPVMQSSPFAMPSALPVTQPIASLPMQPSAPQPPLSMAAPMSAAAQPAQPAPMQLPAPQPAAGEMPGTAPIAAPPEAPMSAPAAGAAPEANALPTGENFNTTPISDLNTMIAQPRTPDEKLAAINEIANRQHGDRQTYELLKQEISIPMQGIPPETASAIRQAALIALGSLNGSPVNSRLAGNELYGIEGISKILNDKNENPLVKASAVAALGYMNRPQDKTIQHLLKRAAKDTNPDVKNAVAQVQAGQINSLA